MIKILITSSGGPLVPALTKFLKNDHQLEKIYIVGIDRKKIKKTKICYLIGNLMDGPNIKILKMIIKLTWR